MANYATLKAAIQSVLKTNGNNEITGALLQQSLLAMIDSLGSNYLYAGIATPNTTPGTPDQNVFYIAGPGTYPNFNSVVVPSGYVGFFQYNGSWNNEIVQLTENYDVQFALLNDIANDLYNTRFVDISTRQEKIKGYAGASGDFRAIGTAGQYFVYVPVLANTRYHLTGTYNFSGSVTYANILFCPTIPETGTVGIVIDYGKNNGDTFDFYYTPQTNGYIFIWSRNADVYYDAFFEEMAFSKIDDLEKTDANIKIAVDYTEAAQQITGFQSVKGYVLSSGRFTKIADDTSALSLAYFQVVAGTKYHLTGTHANNSSYGSIIFSESFPVTGDFGIIIKMSVSGAAFDVEYTPDLNGYLFISASAFTVTTNVVQQSVVLKSAIFGDLPARKIKLVGALYQSIYVVKSSHKIVNPASANGSFVIPVVAGKKYLVRGHVNAYANYSVLAFSDSLTADYSAGVINLVTVSSNNTEYDYSYIYEAKTNGYLIAWSTISGYGSKYYVEAFDVEERQKEIYDYYLPASLKMQLFGDSITDCYWGDMSSWARYIPDNVRIENLTIVNSAVGGAAIGGSGSYNIPNQIMNGYTRDGGTVAPPLASDTEFVVIFAGTNDWSAGGSMSSVLANLATSFQYIYEHSKAKILYCTPLQRYNETDQGRETDANGVPINSLGMTLREFCDNVIQVCKRFSVPVLDLNADANINRYNIFDYSSDGLHPQRDGDFVVSKMICRKIKDLLRG